MNESDEGITNQRFKLLTTQVITCDVFIAMVTKNIWSNPEFVYKWNLAKHLHKPFIVVIEASVNKGTYNKMVSNAKVLGTISYNLPIKKIHAEITKILKQYKYL